MAPNVLSKDGTEGVGRGTEEVLLEDIVAVGTRGLPDRSTDYEQQEHSTRIRIYTIVAQAFSAHLSVAELREVRIFLHSHLYKHYSSAA